MQFLDFRECSSQEVSPRAVPRGLPRASHTAAAGDGSLLDCAEVRGIGKIETFGGFLNIPKKRDFVRRGARNPEICVSPFFLTLRT